MKKPFVLIAAIVAVVGLGTGVAVAKETTKVRTSVKLEYSANGAADSSFSGQVKARKGCQKGRTVALWDRYGGHRASDRSDARGRYKITYSPYPGTGPYFAKARERKITKDNGDKIVCREGTSKRVATLR